MRSPLNKAHKLTSSYGMRNLAGKLEMHNGIDLVPLDGKHPCELLAICDGIIEDVRANVPDSHTGLKVTAMITGNYVNIRTKSGYLVIYRHIKAKSIPANIIKGAIVKESQSIGIMGTTGQSTGVHLHFEMRDPNGNSFDPLPYVGTKISFEESFEVSQSSQQSQSSQPMTKQKFIEKLAPLAVKECEKTRILASLCIAQGALESGWGNSPAMISATGMSRDICEWLCNLA